MPIFTGTYENKVDGKGRVSLPADFRDLLSTVDDSRTFYVFPSPQHDALEACDKTFVEDLVNNIESQTDMFSHDENVMSQLVASMRRVSYDSTGRFILPDEFSDGAHIDDSACFVGIGKRFMIWNPKKYQSYAELNIAERAKKGITIKRTRGSGDDRK